MFHMPARQEPWRTHSDAGPDSAEPQPSDAPKRSQSYRTDRAGDESAFEESRLRSSIDEPSKAIRPQSSSSTLQEVLRRGTVPLNFVANAIRSSKRIGGLTNYPMDYFEKVSGMWKGPMTHYGPIEGVAPDDEVIDADDEAANAKHAQRFREHFALPDSEPLVATYYAYWFRTYPNYGKIYVGKNFLCFRALLPGVRTKVSFSSATKTFTRKIELI